MSFLGSIAVLTLVYLAVGRLERLPALRFRNLSSPRPYFATDIAWYGVAVAATALSVFVFRPVLANIAVAPVPPPPLSFWFPRPGFPPPPVPRGRGGAGCPPFVLTLWGGGFPSASVSSLAPRPTPPPARLGNFHKPPH